MNRVYRIVWSRVRHAWVVASELATSRSKGRGSPVAVAPLLRRRPATARLRQLDLGMLAALVVLGAPAHADDKYWDANGTGVGLGGTGIWELGPDPDPVNGRWSSNPDGVSGPYSGWNSSALDHAIFQGTAGTVTLGGPITVGGITFSTNGYALTGNALTLGGATPTITVSAGTSIIGSVIGGTAGLTKTGNGTLYLQGANTFSGGITLSGALRAASDAALGAFGNGITTTASADFHIDSGSTNRTVTIGAGTTLTVRGVGTGSALYAGDGNLSVVSGVTLSNDASTYTGTTRLNGVGGGSGNIFFTSLRNLGEASSLGAPTTVADGTITFAGGSQYTDRVTYIGSGDSSNRNWVMGGGTARRLFNQGSGTLSITGDIAMSVTTSFEAVTAGFDLLGELSGSAPANFNASSAGSITLGGANIYTGATAIAGGVVTAPVLAGTGVSSSLGIGSEINLGHAGVLRYTGAGGSSDRIWTSNGATGISNDGTGALTLSGALSFNPANPAPDSLTFGGAYAGTNVYSGVISGAGNLVSTGSSVWELSGANTRTGTITVDGGTLRAGSASAFGSVTGVNVNGGVLDLNGFDLNTPTLNGTGGTIAFGGGTLAVSNTTANVFAGSMTGAGGLDKAGAGMLTLTGASSYSGATTLGGGTLHLDFSAAGAPASDILSGSSTLNMAGGTLGVTGAGGVANTQSFDGLNVAAGSNRINAVSAAGGSVTIDLGAIAQTSGLVDFILPDNGNITTTNVGLGGWATVNSSDYAKVVGGNIVAFEEADYTDKDDASTWANGEFISDTGGVADTPFFGALAGNVQLGGLRYTANAASTVNIGAGNTFGVDGAIIIAPSVLNSNLTVTGGVLLGAAGGGALGVQQNSTGNFVIESVITNNGGASSFVKGGAGTVWLNDSNTYAGGTTLSGGRLEVTRLADGGVSSSIGSSSADSSNLVLESGTLAYVGGVDAVSNRGFTLVNGGAGDPAIEVNAGRTLEFSGWVTSPDDAGLTKTGAGVLTLANGANDYIGVTTISGGALSIDTIADGGVVSGIGASSSDSANLVLSGGGRLQYTGGTIGSNRGFTLGVGGGGIDVNDAAATLSLGGVATGIGSLTKQGAGTLVLSGINTYTGVTFVNGGTLRAGSTQAFGPIVGGSAVPMTVNAGGVLDLDGFDNTVGPLNGSGAVVLGSATLNVRGPTGNFSGTIGGTGGLVRSGNGIQTITGCNNDYTGVTTIIGSTLRVDCLADGGTASGIGASTADVGNLVFTGNGQLTYTGGDAAIDRGFTLQANTGYLSVDNAMTTLEFGGDVVGSGHLRKEGAGTLVLSGTSTYTGNTTVIAGTLRAGVTNAFGTSAAAGGMALTNTAGVTLDLDGFDTTVSYLNGGGINGGDILLDDGTLTIRLGNNGAATIYAGAIDGAGDLVKNGAQIQRLHGCNSSYTGTTTINAGALSVTCLEDGGANSSIGASGAGPGNLVLNGGTLQYVGEGGSTNREFTLGMAGGALDASGTAAITYASTAPITLVGSDTAHTLTLTGTNSDNNTLAGLIANNGAGTTSLTKLGTGTWILSNPYNTYTGVTTISGGVLGVDKLADGGLSSSLGASSSAAANLVIGNGSTLRYTGSGDTTDRLFTLSPGVTFIESSGSGAIVFTDTGPVTLQGNNQARTIALGGTNTGNNTLAGSIGNAGTGITTLAKNDSGTWVLTGDHTYTGNTNINVGTLLIGGGGTTGSITSSIVNNLGTLGFDRSDTATYGGVVQGSGAVNQVGAGTTVLTGANTYTGGTTIAAGVLQLGDGGTTGAIVGDVLNDGTLTFNRSNAYTFGGLISGNGAVNQIGNGTTVLTGSNTYAGSTTVQAGTLLVNGDQSGAIGPTEVQSGGTLGGTGIIGGDVTVADGGAFDPGTSPGTLTINGDLTLDPGSILNYEFGQANVVGGPLNDLTVVQGSLVLDGTLNVTVTPGGSFGPGLYRIISYGGALTDNGLDLGAMPPGSYQVQTSVASQVNLLNTGDLTLNFWDGDAGPKSDGVIQGGDGSWQAGAGNDNWTDQTGDLNAPHTDGDFAIFLGAPGTVTIDNTLGDVRASGLQFGVDGYVLNGGPLELVGASSIIRVGDGTAAGAGMAATVEAALTGNTELIKADLGTLALTGTNTYTGGTTIEAGTLEVANDGNLGAAAGGLGIDGGTLRNTAVFASARSVTLEENGGTFETLADLALSGTIEGTGSLTKTGAGTLTLDGTNTYAGGTAINGGTVVVSSDANLGQGSGPLALDSGTLRTTVSFGSARTVTLEGGGGTFETLASLALTGVIEGTGALTKTGGGTLALTGGNTYAGGTTIADGTLQLGDGGTSGSIAGDVLNDGALVFNRADLYSFEGLISGGGAIEQIGTGTTVLAGDNVYAGTTAARAGSLIVNGDQAAATGLTTVDSGGTLGGAGVIGGDVVVADGGVMRPGDVGDAPGTLTVNGSLTLGETSLLEFNFGQANVVGGPFNDLIRVGGDLVLDGTLDVTTSPGGDFGAGIYRVIGYDGTLTDDGLDIGTVPSPEYFLQTAVANQINLVNTAGLALNFWDGEGARDDGVIQGGDGDWQSGAGNDNWTDDAGDINAPYQDDDFAIFTGTAGTVSVDNSLGAVSASGMQFAVDGYAIDGDTLTLVGASSVIRVGDGTTEAAGMTAMIAAELSGDAALEKTDLGTLVLAADNTYTGGTTISTGTLALGNGGAFGSIVGDVLNDGTLAFNRSDAHTFDGLVSGDGAVSQVGSGTTVLTADNTYAGPTTVEAGSLRVEGNQSGATGLMSVLDGGTLGGTGIIGGDVTVADGGAINPGGVGDAAGTLTINGGLALSAGSILNYNFGEANVEGGPLNDLILVGGDLSLDGMLNVTVTPGGSFDTGVYRVIRYDGTLTDHGLAVGTIPSPDFFVQTSVANQINLINTAGLTLNFWDGSGGANDGVIGGGSGVWRLADNDYWTTDAGAINAPYGDGAFAVFMGTPGTVTIDGANGQVTASGLQFAVDGYVVDGDALTLAGASSAIRVGDGTADGASMTATIESVLDGDAALDKIDLGTLVLAGANTYGGPTTVQAGSLIVNGDQSGATGVTSVDSGGILGGTGVIGGDTTVADGGTIRPGGIGNAAGTLTLNGSLTLDGGSSLDYDLGEANEVGGPLNDLLRVGGDLTLGGTLNVAVSAGGSVGAGIYRVIGYDGALTDNGLALGAMPPGDFLVQTAIAHQVNLVNTAGVELNFWDGPSGGVDDGLVHGGDGVWRLADNAHWTGDTGTLNGPYSNGAFAVFTGTPGTITVDNSLGDIAASGLQFAVGGYEIDGDPLTLSGPVIRVGDGTADGAAMTATIRSALIGTSGLAKTDLGTLVLASDMTYTGGTTITAGTLQIGDGGTTGSISGDVINDAALVFNRSDTHVFAGSISGSGAVMQTGSGTTILTGTHGYTGGTTISAGTLQVDGAISGATSVQSGGALSGTGTVGSVTTLTGGFVAPGNAAMPFGTLTLAGDYAGGGTVLIRTELGGDTSATSRLEIHGSTIGAASPVLVDAAGGDGAPTTGDGIAIIQVDGESPADSFHLAQPVQAGAYEYLLYQGGTSDTNDWFLRSDLIDPESPVDPDSPAPAYRPAVAGYALGPQVDLEYGFTALGNLRARVGDQSRVLDAEAAERRADGWMRVYRHDLDAVGSRFEAKDMQMTALQFGTDILRHGAGRADARLGVMFSVGESSGRFFDSERALAELDTYAGKVETDVKGGGLYWTRYAAGGQYLDLSAQVLHYSNRYRDRYDAGSRQSGWGGTVAAEIGAPFGLGATGWRIEPQLQLAYQRLELDGFTDDVSTVSEVDADALRARAGVQFFRAPGEWFGMSDASPYVMLGVQRDFRDAPSVTLADATVRDELPNTTADLGVGFTGSVRPGLELHFDVRYQQATTGERDGIRANLGFRARF